MTQVAEKLTARERLIETITYCVKQSTEMLRKDVAALNEQAQGDKPWALAYDFEWAEGTLARAATLKEEQRLLERLQRIDDETGEPFPLAQMVEWYTEDVLRDANYPESSTSKLSNLMNRTQLAARATLLEKLRFHAKAEREGI
jgi:hypothetical protein